MQRKPDPPPLRTNDVLTVQVGTAVWAVVLVVSAILRNGAAVRTSLAGVLLGFVGIAYVKRRARKIGPGDGGS